MAAFHESGRSLPLGLICHSGWALKQQQEGCFSQRGQPWTALPWEVGMALWEGGSPTALECPACVPRASHSPFSPQAAPVTSRAVTLRCLPQPSRPLAALVGPSHPPLCPENPHSSCNPQCKLHPRQGQAPFPGAPTVHTQPSRRWSPLMRLAHLHWALQISFPFHFSWI